jgi:hypothetical protein
MQVVRTLTYGIILVSNDTNPRLQYMLFDLEADLARQFDDIYSTPSGVERWRNGSTFPDVCPQPRQHVVYYNELHGPTSDGAVPSQSGKSRRRRLPSVSSSRDATNPAITAYLKSSVRHSNGNASKSAILKPPAAAQAPKQLRLAPSLVYLGRSLK